jgi:hypothetical protein
MSARGACGRSVLGGGARLATASAEDRYLGWKRREDVGCVFARWLSLKPRQHGQRIVVSNSVIAVDAARDIASTIASFVDDPQAAGATLLFPNVTTLETLVHVAQALRAEPHWQIDVTTLHGTPGGDVLAFRMARSIPFDDKTIPSEALVLGPFDEFPRTRRAPVTALEIFVGNPPAIDYGTKKPPAKANLAHIEIDHPDQSFFDSMWDNTKRLREKVLGGVDMRAKAKVSFVVPIALARKLGCIE